MNIVNKKNIKIKLNGFDSCDLKIKKVEISIDVKATINDVIEHIKNIFGKNIFGNELEYSYRFQANYFMVFVNDEFVVQNEWEKYVVPCDCDILIVPPFSDG